MPLDKPLDSGRVYPAKVVQKAIAKIQPAVKGGTFYAYLSDSGEVLPAAALNQANAAALVRSVTIDGSAVVGRFETLDTPRGRMLEQIIRSDKVMFRPMGEGTAGPDGKVVNYTITGISIFPRA